MADETFDPELFGQEAEQDEFPRTQPEGVRIIGAREAAGAASPTNAVSEDDLPRFQPAVADAADHAGAPPDVIPVQEVAEIPAVDPEQSFEMPHYSEPPTGQVPKVVIGEETDVRWSGLADQPRWRDTEHHFDEQIGFEDLADDSPRLGALAPTAEHTGIFADLELTDDRIPTLASPGVRTEGSTETSAASGGPVVGPAAGLGPETPSRAATLGGGQRPADTAPAEEDVLRRPPTPRRRRAGSSPDAQLRAPGTSSPAEGRNLPLAAGVGVGLLALGGACFYAGALATTLLVAAILCLCAGEMFTALKTSGYRPATLLGMTAVAGLAIAPLYEGYFAYPVVFGLATIIGLAWFLFVQPGEGAIMNLGVTLLAVLWIGGLGSFASLAVGVARDAETPSTSNQGIGVVVAAILVAVSYDVGAYFVGRSLGRTPLSAASPNKTQEGLLGGVAAAILIPFVILFFGEWHPVFGDGGAKAIIAFCLICAVMAPVGDLCESAVKRDLGVKDMGSVLPGHGGVLDRFDGILFVLPTAYFMAHLLELGSPTMF